MESVFNDIQALGLTTLATWPTDLTARPAAGFILVPAEEFIWLYASNSAVTQHLINATTHLSPRAAIADKIKRKPEPKTVALVKAVRGRPKGTTVDDAIRQQGRRPGWKGTDFSSIRTRYYQSKGKVPDDGNG